MVKKLFMMFIRRGLPKNTGISHGGPPHPRTKHDSLGCHSPSVNRMSSEGSRSGHLRAGGGTSGIVSHRYRVKHPSPSISFHGQTPFNLKLPNSWLLHSVWTSSTPVTASVSCSIRLRPPHQSSRRSSVCQVKVPVIRSKS